MSNVVYLEDIRPVPPRRSFGAPVADPTRGLIEALQESREQREWFMGVLMEFKAECARYNEISARFGDH